MTGKASDDGPGSHRAATAAGGRLHSTRRNVLKLTGAAAVGGALGGTLPGLSSAAPANEPVPLERESRNSNLIVDPQGNQVTVRGVNIVDPYRAARDAPHYKYRGERSTQLATNPDNGWHANCIRVPMQPNDIARQGAGSVDPGAYSQEQLDSYISQYVDPIVEECAYQGVYCILDYHRHWPDGPRWDDAALDEEITAFWETVAPRYDDRDHVIYELYNEPTEPYAGYQLGPNEGVDVTESQSEETWLTWKETAQPWVNTVREHSDNLLLIGNPRWSQWTYWAANSEEFEGENLAYVGHFYTQENLRPLSTYFGEPSREVPVFITEFGFGGSEEHMNGTVDEHGPEFEEFFSEYDTCHWTAWCFDFDWGPAMLDRDYQVATPWGEWVKSHLDQWAGDSEPYDPNAGVSRPATPSDLEATAIGDTAVEVDFTPVDGADGYNVYATQELRGQTSGPPVAVGGFEPSSLAWVGIVAYNAGGTSSYVEVEVNTAPEGEGDDVTADDLDGGGNSDGDPQPPTSPGDQWANEVTSTSIDLGWESVANASSYVVYVDGSEYGTTSSTSTTITGLSPDTDYEVGIQASNSAGTSETVTTTITTAPDDGTGPTCGGEPVNATATVDGRTVCDVDGNDLYRDVSADGTVTQTDVVEFFNVQHREAWKQPSMFDFSGDDSVGHGDVVALFEYATSSGL